MRAKMLKYVAKNIGGGLYEIQAFKNNNHSHSIDGAYTQNQAKNLCNELTHLTERLNYLEPLQKKFEAQLLRG